VNELSLSPKHIIRADATGYAIVKFSDGVYARLMWSFVKSRIIHGQIIRMDGDLPRVLAEFDAFELSAYRGVEMKYCR
jgi:hypothetical protein